MTYTLVADGTSDAVLVPILTWSLRQQEVKRVMAQWADLGRIPHRQTREEILSTVLELYPCDVLFVHRDAENQAPELRRLEIANTLRKTLVKHVAVVPIRMTEAWLLADEQAIRSAAGNPNGKEELNLPDVRRLEDLPDPKKILHDALSIASGLNVRRRSRLRVHQRVQLIPNYIDDYSCLNDLTAFQELQKDIRTWVGNR